jgi:biotin transport system permease protein
MTGHGRSIGPGAGPAPRAQPALTAVKLATLAAFSLTVVLVPGMVVAGVGATIAAVLALVAGVPRRGWRGAVLFAVLVGTGRTWSGGPSVGLAAALDVLALVLAGAVLVARTPPDELLDLLPGRLGLAAVLMLRSIPGLTATVAATREAARARGCERDPRTWLTPAAIRAVARAHATGEALVARGLGDEPTGAQGADEPRVT